MKRKEHIVRLRVCCLQPPDPAKHNAEFGLQEKRPGDWLVHPGARQRAGDLHFECESRAILSAGNTSPDFAGQFIHGKRGERFLYLSWKPKGWRAGEPEPGPPVCVRRMKIHLKSITKKQIQEAIRRGGVLEVTVVGTAKDGGPACASVPLLGGGWKVA